MIRNGDRILVGLSGGKDSLTLLWMLEERRRRVPIDYMLFPVYVDPGFEGGFDKPLKSFCEQFELPLRVERTDFGVQAHSDANRENPCFLCARLRRKRLFEVAKSLQCQKIALGHHKDDIIESLLINMFYAGQISTMMPLQSLFNGMFTLIRPLALAAEESIQRFAVERQFPQLHNPCPSAYRSKRSEIKAMLQKMYLKNPKIRGNIFRSMSRVRSEYLL